MGVGVGVGVGVGSELGWVLGSPLGGAPLASAAWTTRGPPPRLAHAMTSTMRKDPMTSVARSCAARRGGSVGGTGHSGAVREGFCDRTLHLDHDPTGP